MAGEFLGSTISLKHSVFSANFTPPSTISSQDWILDTGATDHMVQSISLLTTITSTVNLVVNLPNGHKAVVTHIGNLVSDTVNIYTYSLLCSLCANFFF